MQHFNLFQNIYFLYKQEIRISFRSTVSFDWNNTPMGPILHNSFNDWITDMFVTLFSSLLFLRKSFVLTIIALDKFLFIKGEWLPLTYFFLRGAYWSRILLQDIKKSSTSWSHVFPKFRRKFFCNESPKILLLKFL